MLKRVLTGIVGLIIILPVFVFSGYEVGKYVFIGLFFLLTIMSLFEAGKCIGLSKKFWIVIPTYVFSAAYMVAVIFFSDTPWGSTYLIPIIACFIFVIFAISMLSRGVVRVSQTAEMLLVSSYVTVGLTSVVLLRYSNETYGNLVYLLIFVGAWMTDTGAYFIGRFLGKHKLIPTVSPKKTVEGAIGGIVVCMASFAGYALLVSNIHSLKINWLALLLAGLFVSVISQFGDLIMSYLKREHGIKDFSSLLPGHGGILDRFDSMIPVAMFLYILNTVFKVMIFYE